jgi:methyl coenzyme M reductase subunit D
MIYNDQNETNMNTIIRQMLPYQFSLGHHKLTSRQIALRNLQKIGQKCNYQITGNNITSVMRQLLLARFPNGTDLLDGKISSMDKIKKVTVIELESAIQEWSNVEGIEQIQKYFAQVIPMNHQIDIEPYNHDYTFLSLNE